MAVAAPMWVRCPSCDGRARAAKVKNEGKPEALRLRNGAFLFECSTPGDACGLRLGVFSVFADEDGGALVDADAPRLEAALDEFWRHARVVESCLGAIRGAPLSARRHAGVLRHAAGAMLEALDGVEGALP